MEGRQPAGDIDLTIRRVFIGYRVVAALWLVSLGVVELITGDPEQRGVVVATMIGTIVWAAITVVVHARAARLLRMWAWLALDAGAAAWALMAPLVAGSGDFYGGYPMSAIFLAASARGMLGGLTSSMVVAGGELVRWMTENPVEVTTSLARVINYLFAGAVASWAIGLLRSSDLRRHTAEEALASERERRGRAEERAEVASHLHDSVLQTLSLIQQNSTRPQEVVVLARSQERDLRGWLFEGAPPGQGLGLMEEVRALCTEVEQRHHVPIELVTVGDAPADERLGALLRAGREAVVNAAVHSGAESVSVYAEATGERISMFIRDRGSGFDVQGVSEDRRGISDSIIGRMARHEGTVAIRSIPGQGTEVELVMQR